MCGEPDEGFSSLMLCHVGKLLRDLLVLALNIRTSSNSLSPGTGPAGRSEWIVIQLDIHLASLKIHTHYN